MQNVMKQHVFEGNFATAMVTSKEIYFVFTTASVTWNSHAVYSSTALLNLYLFVYHYV